MRIVALVAGLFFLLVSISLLLATLQPARYPSYPYGTSLMVLLLTGIAMFWFNRKEKRSPVREQVEVRGQTNPNIGSITTNLEEEEEQMRRKERILKEGDFDQGRLTLTSERTIFKRGDKEISIPLELIRSVSTVRKGIASKQTLEIRYSDPKTNENIVLDLTRVSVSAAFISPALYTIREDPYFSEWASAVNTEISQYHQAEMQSRPLGKREDKVLEILRERYAKGEISREQYEQMKKDLTRLDEGKGTEDMPID